MSLDQNKIAEDLAQALRAIESASDLDGLKQVKIDFVGDKSPLAKANQALATVDQSLRAQFGKLIGTARTEVNQAFEQRSAQLSELRDAQMLLTEKVDVTLPGRRTLKGGLHPLTILTNEINDLFIGLGYKVAEGPELEAEWLNFDALNIPSDHPARTMQDTFSSNHLNPNLFYAHIHRQFK
jgi:phenylalanyl-tRNA synthetase alpha chain